MLFVIFIRLWMFLLIVIDALLVFQMCARIYLYAERHFNGRYVKVSWYRYNLIMLLLLAIAFFPVTAAIEFLRRN